MQAQFLQRAIDSLCERAGTAFAVRLPGGELWRTRLGTPADAAGRAVRRPGLRRAADNVHQALFARTAVAARPLQVYTLHVELEGQRLLPVVQCPLDGWRAQGHRFVTLEQAAAALATEVLPRLPLATGEAPGRSRALQLQHG